MQIIKTVTLDYRQYLTEKEILEIEHEVSIMETRESAGIEALKIVQHHRGWISDESLNAIAQLLAISSAQLEGVATFYNLIYRQPVGRYVIHICDSISCHLLGYQQVLQAIKTHLGIDYGQTTADGLFTLLSNVCLGGCDKAPVMMIGQQHYEHLTSEKAVAILNGLIQSKDGNLPGDILDKTDVGATIVEVKND
ncbi:MAG: NADH-quinone oxidoreductase subunit NuoE [Alteromonadaceae bacterium]|nr:NADH-quinone oxidoreductase subunit NuoE [Alteromonadaceae bacterium]